MQKLKGKALTRRIEEMVVAGRKQADIARELDTTQSNVSRIAKRVAKELDDSVAPLQSEGFRVVMSMLAAEKISPVEFLSIPVVVTMLGLGPIDYFIRKAGYSRGQTLEYFFERYYTNKHIRQRMEGR